MKIKGKFLTSYVNACGSFYSIEAFEKIAKYSVGLPILDDFDRRKQPIGKITKSEIKDSILFIEVEINSDKIDLSKQITFATPIINKFHFDDRGLVIDDFEIKDGISYGYAID